MKVFNDSEKKFFSRINEKLNIRSSIDNIIFIYSLPKVGSTSLVSSIRIFGSQCYDIIHIHDDKMLVFFLEENVSVMDVIYFNKFIGKQVLVINIYREPIERKISDFFEKISFHFNISKDNVHKIPISVLIKRFNNIFDNIESKDRFLNTYQIPLPEKFDFKNKYNLVIFNDVKFLTLRLQDSKTWSNILTSILKHKIVIISDYETSNKTYAELYLAFKKKYQIPINLFDKIKNNSDFNFYLSDDEKNHYINSWQNKVDKEFITYSNEQYLLYLSICSENNIEDKIEPMHYKDEGCLCKACSNNRLLLQNLIMANKYNGETNYHNEIVNNYLNKKKQILNKLIKKKSTNQFQKLRIV